jgi:hypothetical protein
MQKSMLGGWMPIGGGFFCTGFASLLEYVTRAYAKNIDAAWESCWSRSKQLHNPC